VREGKKSEQKQEAVRIETKLDFFVLNRRMILGEPDSWFSEHCPVFSDSVLSRVERPPTPPPRLA